MVAASAISEYGLIRRPGAKVNGCSLITPRRRVIDRYRSLSRCDMLEQTDSAPPPPERLHVEDRRRAGLVKDGSLIRPGLFRHSSRLPEWKAKVETLPMPG